MVVDDWYSLLFLYRCINVFCISTSILLSCYLALFSVENVVRCDVNVSKDSMVWMNPIFNDRVLNNQCSVTFWTLHCFFLYFNAFHAFYLMLDDLSCFFSMTMLFISPILYSYYMSIFIFFILFVINDCRRKLSNLVTFFSQCWFFLRYPLVWLSNGLVDYLDWKFSSMCEFFPFAKISEKFHKLRRKCTYY